MVTQIQYNEVVRKYNEIINRPPPVSRDSKEILHSGEAIAITEDGITLNSNVLAITDLKALLIEMLQDKTIKEYINGLKEKKRKRLGRSYV